MAMGRVRGPTLVLLLVAFVKTGEGTVCAINQDYPASQPGNSHICPDTLDNGDPNPMNTCCWDDRPDAEGNYHHCCVSEAERNAARGDMLVLVLVPMCCGLFGLGVAVGVWTYCREDTVKFLKPIRNGITRWFNIFNDAICFCTCCPKGMRRSKEPKLDENKDIMLDDPFWA